MNSSMETNLVSLNPFIAIPLHRRDFLRMAASSAIGLVATGTLRAQSTGVPRVPLGLDAHSLRGMRWKAPRLIDYATEHKLDAVLLNNLNTFERQHQQSEFEKSIAYLRRHCGAGINHRRS